MPQKKSRRKTKTKKTWQQKGRMPQFIAGQWPPSRRKRSAMATATRTIDGKKWIRVKCYSGRSSGKPLARKYAQMIRNIRERTHRSFARVVWDRDMWCVYARRERK